MPFETGSIRLEMFGFVEWFAGLPKWPKLTVAVMLLVLGWALEVDSMSGAALIGLGVVLLLATFSLQDPD